MPRVPDWSQLLLPTRRISTHLPEDYWDAHEASQMVSTGQAKVRVILQWIEPGLVLDVGCNDGGIAHCIRETGARVIGADRLRYVEIASRDYGLPVVALDARWPLPFSRGSFDVVVISGVLEYIAEPLALLKEARRVLCCRGRLILVAPNRNSIRSIYHRLRGTPATAEESFESADLPRMLREAGFSIRAFRPCPYKSNGSWRAWVACRLEQILPGRFASDFAFLCYAQ